MIPPFDANGNLPPGTHPATIAEVVERFSRPRSLARHRRTTSLQSLYDQTAVLHQGLYINGSYITSKLAPNDVDIAIILPPGFDVARVQRIARRFADLDVFPCYADTPRLASLVSRWSQDRDDNQKGLIYIEPSREVPNDQE